MSVLVTIALICVCAKLWKDLGLVRGRVAFLEASVEADRASTFTRPPEPVAPSVQRPAPYAATRPPVTVVTRDVVEEDVDADDDDDVRLDASPVMARMPGDGPSDIPMSAPAAAPRSAVPPPRFRTPAEDPEPSRSFGMEDVFGRLLPIWAGGITLAVAGLLIVKWSIDAGILSPAVRVLLGALFGVGLIGGAEIALRRAISDERIPQALAGAGVASLYGAVLAANLHYGLLDAGPALVLMVLVTVAASLLSFRFGAPSAVLGLVGGLAAPALVGAGQPSVPLLSVYVGMMSAGLGFVARVQGRAWLGAAAIAGGMLWCVALLGLSADPVSAICLGFLLIGLGLALPSVLHEVEGVPVLRLAGAAIACVQIAALVAIGGFGAMQWGMLLLATAATLALSEFDDRLRPLAAPLLALGLLLASGWTDATSTGMAVVLGAFAVLHVVHALRHLSLLGDARIADGARLVLLPSGIALVAALRFPHMGDVAHAALFGAAGLLTAVACLVVQRSVVSSVARPAQPLAVAMVLGALWFVLPVEAMPLACALAALGLAWTPRWLPGTLAATLATALWSLEPLATWAAGALGSAMGQPFLTGALPPIDEVAWRMLPAIALGGVLAFAHRDRAPLRMAGLGLLSLAAVVVHVMWRGVMGIDTMDAFAARGMLDRTLLEALLAIAAVGAWRLDHRVSVGLGLASLAHFGWFSLLLHDPLWSDQAVGAVPLANLVTVSFGTALALLWLGGRIGLDEVWGRACRIVQIVLIVAMGFTELRQMVSGSLLQAVDVTVGEQIGRSILAIMLAIAFLVHGIVSMRIEWRVGSLVLMLVAVAKVFLFDAAGLDGLARILSFAALGFSLIGVGWLYSRLLPGSPKSA